MLIYIVMDIYIYIHICGSLKCVCAYFLMISTSVGVFVYALCVIDR